MNFKEALQALIDGEKIRKVDWDDGAYLHFKGFSIVDEDGYEYCLGGEGDEDSEWEIYEGKKDLPEDVKNEIKEIILNSINEVNDYYVELLTDWEILHQISYELEIDVIKKTTNEIKLRLNRYLDKVLK